LEGVERGISSPVPKFAAPISRASQEAIIKEGVGSNFVNGTIMSRVNFKVLLSIAFRAPINNTFFSCCKIH
jgi:hypothetical protein